ncbi:MAG TPA: antibiotic biosynthesis monooxygenase [Ktedonobacterales bacterium]
MFVAVNRIAAPQEAMDRMTEAFRRNATSLKDFEGFIAFELWRGESSLDAVSKWESRAAYDAWRTSDNFLAAHAGGRGGQSGGSSVAFYEGETITAR